MGRTPSGARCRRLATQNRATVGTRACANRRQAKHDDERGNRIHLGLAKGALAADVAEKLAPKAVHGEEIVVRGDALWIDFRKGVGDSKLVPAFINKCAGGPVTLRNWRTVLKLAEMAKG